MLSAYAMPATTCLPQNIRKSVDAVDSYARTDGREIDEVNSISHIMWFSSASTEAAALCLYR